jgi:hypothetical protein
MTDPVLPVITYREMTAEEIMRLGQPRWRVMLAFHEQTLIAFYMVEQNAQFRFCDTCLGNCVTGKGFWVDPAYRSQGVFTVLWTTMRDTFPITKWYGEGSGTPDTATYYWKFDVAQADNFAGNVKTRAERTADAARLRSQVLAALTPEV